MMAIRWEGDDSIDPQKYIGKAATFEGCVDAGIEFIERGLSKNSDMYWGIAQAWFYAASVLRDGRNMR